MREGNLKVERLQKAGRDPSPHAAASTRRLSPLVLAALGTTASSVDVWLLMNVLFPPLQSLWAPAVTIQAVAAAAGYALVALLALRLPHRTDPVALSAVSAVLIVGGTLVWWHGMAVGSAAVATLGVCAAHFGCAWPRISVGTALCALSGKRALVAAAMAGELTGAAVRCLVPVDLPFGAVLAAVAAVELLMLAVGHVGGAPFLHSVRAARADASPADLATTNPESFVKPSHRLFVLIAFFEVIHGISLAEKTSEMALAANALVVAVLACGAVWLYARRSLPCEDWLLCAAALLMLAGFVMRPSAPVEAMLSSVCSFAGAAFSWVLIWTVFASIGISNPAGALWALGIGYTMQALGLEAGSVLGRISSSGLAASESTANVVNSLVVVAFIGYLLIGMRGFSFSAAFAGIVPVAALRPTEDPDAKITRGCQALAAHCGLSERELEVAGLLARGRTGPQIQDELSISRNTCKTHVRHIYRKLDVHSQQELIDLVAAQRG